MFGTRLQILWCLQRDSIWVHLFAGASVTDRHRFLPAFKKSCRALLRDFAAANLGSQSNWKVRSDHSQHVIARGLCKDTLQACTLWPLSCFICCSKKCGHLKCHKSVSREMWPWQQSTSSSRYFHGAIAQPRRNYTLKAMTTIRRLLSRRFMYIIVFPKRATATVCETVCSWSLNLNLTNLGVTNYWL